LQLQSDEKAHAEKHLAKVITVLTGKGIKAGFSVELANDVAGCIIEVAVRERVDFVVISTHGISGWRPLVFGSIAEKVIKLIQFPLLLLHSAKEDINAKTPSDSINKWW
jgi:nucleotide-binding universal stress UspA family protein